VTVQRKCAECEAGLGEWVFDTFCPSCFEKLVVPLMSCSTSDLFQMYVRIWRDECDPMPIFICDEYHRREREGNAYPKLTFRELNRFLEEQAIEHEKHEEFRKGIIEQKQAISVIETAIQEFISYVNSAFNDNVKYVKLWEERHAALERECDRLSRMEMCKSNWARFWGTSTEYDEAKRQLDIHAISKPGPFGTDTRPRFDSFGSFWFDDFLQVKNIKKKDLIINSRNLDMLKQLYIEFISFARDRVASYEKTYESLRCGEFFGIDLETYREEKAERLKKRRLKRIGADNLLATTAAHRGKTRDLAATVRREIFSQLEISKDCPYCGCILGDAPVADHIYPVAAGWHCWHVRLVNQTKSLDARRLFFGCHWWQLWATSAHATPAGFAS